MVTLAGWRPRCPFPLRWLFIKNQKWPQKICEVMKSDTIPCTIPLSVSLHLSDMQQIEGETVHVQFPCTLTIICIQRGLMGWGGGALKAIITCSACFPMMWLAWITVPPAPIPFTRLQHTGRIVQLTKWPLNHVIVLSVYHRQKYASLSTQFSWSPTAEYNGILMKCIKCPYIRKVTPKKVVSIGLFIVVYAAELRLLLLFFFFLAFRSSRGFSHDGSQPDNENRCTLAEVVASFVHTAA